MQIGISIVKSVQFRGAEQEFSNTYYYELGTAVTAPAETLADEIVTKERTLHSTFVSFKRQMVWSAGGTAAQNQMLHQKALTGTGSQLHEPSMDRERAVLVQWKAGFDSRGIQVYLRKWYHSCGNCAGSTVVSTGTLGNTAPIADASQAAISTSVNDLKDIGVGDFWTLCAKSGRNVQGDAVCHKWLEHHQLGDQWRG